MNRFIDRLIVHCSDSKDGNVQTIRDYHMRVKGWNDIGYHYVILKNGVIETGRPAAMIGAHAEGHNKSSIGVCLIGKEYNEFTFDQFVALKFLYHKLVESQEIGIQVSDTILVSAHYEVDLKGKTCPNLNANLLRAFLYG